MQSANFWTGGSFVVNDAECIGIGQEGLQFVVSYTNRNKQEQRNILAKFPSVVDDEYMLKNVLLEMALNVDQIKDTSKIALLPFGESCTLPLNFRWNDVPHHEWVRSYLYEMATNAVLKAINDDKLSNKSRMQMKFNFPEVNPAYDTYRIGTILEMIRQITLSLTCNERKKVRICVQQSLGEGIFTGLPLAIGAMRPILEKMDWGQELTKEQKFQPGDNVVPRSEAMIRLGTIGPEQIQDDDDVLIIICPQNVIGGILINLLDDMIKSANGRPVILFNPSLSDRPSSNNMMQIRGRAERKQIEKSFVDIATLRIIYPTAGGYMYPIAGMVVKKDYRSPWVAYSRNEKANGDEEYIIEAAFPPQTPPDPEILRSLLV